MPEKQTELQFFNARNGQLSCSADGRFLHSSFNPENEALRFVQSINTQFMPSAIILLGACLPWCVKYLREQFSSSLLISVQFDRRFEEYADYWDSVFYVTDADSAVCLSNGLFNLLGEEKLVTSLFLSWKAAEGIWPNQYKFSWEAIKSSMEKAQSILTTRNWFNIRWFTNTVKNLSLIKEYSLPERTSSNIIVTASGPSLTAAIPFLKKNRKSFILLAASSSISTLLFNDIVPDYCISTDGGWYATRHLRAYETDKRLKDVPLVISAESAVPSRITGSIPIILLTYGDGLESILAEKTGIPSVSGLRNGTVSGTAAAFAASLTTGNVYICGLDLAPGKGFQHAEPNENDVALFTGQTRIKTLESSYTSSRFGSGSLSIYRDWFSHQNEAFTSRVFRLISKNDRLEKLGTMQDVYIEELDLHKAAQPMCNKKTVLPDNDSIIKSYLTSICTSLENNPSDAKNSIWYSSLSLKRYINYLRMNSEKQKAELALLVSETVSVIKEVISDV
ncbi:MAG: DUF115 domain-containing protein [Treponema sp.]|nr:DUF115 domain-containing protein [Candidatus Treponema caballi]